MGAINLLPDVGTGALQTRKGYRRLPGFNLPGYTVRSIHPYNRLTASGTEQYLILVATTYAAAPAVDNVVVWKYDLVSEVAGKISPSQTWQDPSGFHWGFTANETHYGGAESEPMYSWNPTDGWQSDIGSKSRPLFVADASHKAGAEVSTAGGREWAVKPKKGNRFQDWEQGTDADPVKYARGDKVSLKIGGTTWKSFKALEKFESTTANPHTPPGPKWKKIGLKPPVGPDGDTNDDVWVEIPDAPKTSVAWWYGNRMFARHDNRNKQTVWWSTMASELDGSLKWYPANWNARIVTGAGFQPFMAGDGDRLTAGLSFGTYNLIFSLRNCWVIAGQNPATWTIRQVAPRGCVNSRAVAEHDGLVYFLGDQGFFYTDGTQVQEVPGAENFREWLREAINWDGNVNTITLWSFRDFLWMSVPTGSDTRPDRTICYDPGTKSFWKLDLPIQAAAVNRKDGTDRLFFSIPTKTGNHKNAAYAWAGAAHESMSTRTIGGVVETNRFRNVSFEAFVADRTPNQWSLTNSAKVDAKASKAASRRGNKGAEVSSRILTTLDPSWHGMYDTSAENDTTTHHMSAYVRRPHWRKHKQAPDFKFFVGNDQTGQLTTTFTKIGRGWYRAYAEFAGSLSTRNHGFVVAPFMTVQVDQVMLVKGPGPVPYFDGNGGADSLDHVVRGGGQALVFQYDSPTANDQDDGGEPVYTADDIGWSMRTAWFPFGAQREERRIRRIWAMIRGLTVFSLRTYTGYNSKGSTVTEGEMVDDNTVSFVEGNVGAIADTTSISLRIEGESAPAAVLATAVHTQPRRVRFHQN